MAQGGSIKKSASKFVLPSKTKSKSVPKKPKRTKKGPFQIAPKKSKLLQEKKLKDNLRKAIGQKIEEEIVSLASSKGENLRILSASSASSSADSKGKKKQKKKS